MSYKVKLDVFEGPFDLLVYLIENAEMSIYDINVSEIVSQYVEYIEQMQKMDIPVATEFMVLAASLIEIKSKMLLPRMNADGEEMTAEDPRTELVQKILEYKRFKAAAAMLSESEEYMQRIFEKPQEDISAFENQPDEYLKMDLGQFVNAFNLFLSKKKRVEDVKKRYTKLERQRISIEHKISFIKS
ncbi:MAG: segregation/condensation protein A, partial [Firmicutes bacterium]|nr:segregation/condensation protein A [Bacillota bacterium]